MRQPSAVDVAPAQPPRLEVINSATTPDERLYTELLFDFESVRHN